MAGVYINKPLVGSGQITWTGIAVPGGTKLRVGLTTDANKASSAMDSFSYALEYSGGKYYIYEQGNGWTDDLFELGTYDVTTPAAITYDGVKINYILGTTIVRTKVIAENQTFYGKQLTSGLGVSFKLFRADPHTNNSWSNQSGVGLPASNATRNADGANMIPSPVTLDQASFINGGFPAGNPGAGGRVAARYHHGINTGANATIYWCAPGAIPCVPLERLFYRHAVYADASFSDTAKGGIEFYDIAGSLISTALMDESAIAGSATNGFFTEKGGSLLAPATAAFARPFARRELSTTGTFYIGEPYLGRSQPGAEISYSINGTPTESINANSDGIFTAGLLPKYLYFNLLKGNVDITTDSSVSWSFNTISGVNTATAGVVSSKYRISVNTLDSTSVFEAIATIAGVVVARFRTTLTKNLAAAPTGSSGSGGGTTATTTISGTSVNTTYSDMTGVMTCKAGATGKVDLSAPVEYLNSSASTSATGKGKWQWRVIGGVFADVSAETNGIASTRDSEGNVTPGGKTWTAQKTGLTDGVSYEFKFIGASTASARELSWYGVSNASAIGS